MRLVAIVFIVLLVIAAWAGYWVYSSVTATSTTSPSAPLFTYSESSSYDYVARLIPNDLYNTSELGPGNGTLFSQITTWVNISFVYRVGVVPAVNMSSAMLFTVSLGSDHWQKTLEQNALTVPERTSNSLSFNEQFDLNVSAILSLVATIEAQTGYFPSSFWVILIPDVATSVSLGLHGMNLDFEPTLNLTFADGQIEPSGLTSFVSGDYGLPPVVSTSDAVGWLSAAAIPYWLLGVSLPLAAVTGVYAFRHREARPPDIEELMRPYREAIVDAPLPPASTDVVAVSSWEDIVKVADMLGRPILRVAHAATPGAPGSTSFYVVMGTIAYRFSPGASSSGSTNAPIAFPPSPTPKLGRSRSSRKRAEQEFATMPGKGFPSLLDVVEWTGRLSQLVKAMPRSPYRLLAQERILEIVELAKTGELIEAWVALGQLHALLGRSVSGE